MSTFDELPHDVLCVVLEFLDIHEQLQSRGLSTTFLAAIDENAALVPFMWSEAIGSDPRTRPLSATIGSVRADIFSARRVQAVASLFPKCVAPNLESLPRPERTIRMLLLGAPDVGRKTFIKAFPQAVEIQPHVHVIPFCFSSIGTVWFMVRCPPTQLEDGKNEICPMQPDTIAGADVAVIMFDALSRVSYKVVPSVFREIVRVCEIIPIALVANKIDHVDCKVKPRMITFHRKKNLQFYPVSAIAAVNVLSPFVWLTKRFYSDPNLELTGTPIVMGRVRPEEFEHLQSIETAKGYIEAVADASSFAIPFDDDD